MAGFVAGIVAAYLYRNYGFMQSSNEKLDHFHKLLRTAESSIATGSMTRNQLHQYLEIMEHYSEKFVNKLPELSN